MPNFFGNCLAPINVETNVVLDSDSDNSSSNKNSYFSNNYSFLFNYDHYKNNLNGNNNSKSNISSMVIIKKRIWEQQNKTLIATICLCILAYSKNKYNNLLQMVARYIAFAHNMFKQYVEIFHKMNILVTSKTIHCPLKANRKEVL